MLGTVLRGANKRPAEGRYTLIINRDLRSRVFPDLDQVRWLSSKADRAANRGGHSERVAILREESASVPTQLDERVPAALFSGAALEGDFRT